MTDPVAIVYDGFYAVDDAGRILHRSQVGTLHGLCFQKVLTSDNVLILSVTTFHRRVFEALGGFTTEGLHEDRAFILRAARRFPIYPTGNRGVVHCETISGKGRAALRDFDTAVAAEMGVVATLATELSRDERERLRSTKMRALLLRFLIYGFSKSARRLLREVAVMSLLTDVKGVLAVLSFVTNVNLLALAQMSLQRRLGLLGGTLPRPWEHHPRTAVIVSDHLPGHQVGLERSGSARYLAGFVAHLRGEGYHVVWILLRPRLDAPVLDVRRLPFTIFSPSMRRVASRYIVTSPRAVGVCAAYRLYRVLPAPLQHLAEWGRMKLRRARGFMHVLGTFVSPSEQRFVAAAVETLRPDVLLYDSVFATCERTRGRSTWVITQDVKHERIASLSTQGFLTAPRGFDAEKERAILTAMGNVIAIQWSEADSFRRLAPTCRVITVPAVTEIPTVASGVGDGSRCVFIASGSLHNYDGIRWFFDAVWPLVRAEVPNALLDIYGSVCLRLSSYPEGVRLRGIINDVANAYRDAAVVIVPLRMGSGLKVKTVEALAYGAPMVTTAVGAQGLEDIAPAPFLLANGDHAFAAATVRVLRDADLRRELALRARQAAERFTPQRAFEEFDREIGRDLRDVVTALAAPLTVSA